MLFRSPDTLAAILGIQRGDIVIQIGSTKIGGTADVQTALGSVEAGKKVEVHVLRRGKEQVLSAEKPAAEGGEAPKLEKRKKQAPSEIR